MRHAVLTLSILSLAGGLTACVSERVVLLPSPDGRPSALVVRDDRGEQRLDQPYAASVRRSAYNSVKQVDAEQVQRRFAAPLSARPPRARSFILYFDTASDALTPESMHEFEQAKAEIKQREAAEIMVIGHTDRVGSMQDNDALALRRVETVRALLLAAGIAETDIETAARGEREPLVPTKDNVEEPLNRRVEISVR
jgi:outer membrane protein OmpA-like peptidoglycan-associated protein